MNACRVPYRANPTNPTMSTDPAPSSRDGYRWCRELARSHYENFPVASLLLPVKLRDPVAAIYAFARYADDIADEGDASPAERLEQLDAMAQALDSIASGQAGTTPLFSALSDTLHSHDLPVSLLHDLLSAFRQDVSKTRYADFGELMDYCRRSANPVGRLLLHLNRQHSERNLAFSDAICSALQLINFIQDVAQDYDENARIYLPADEMQRFGVSAETIRRRDSGPAFRALVEFQVQRAGQLLRAGSPLGTLLPGRFGLEIRAIVLGGARILEKLRRQDDLYSRPRLNRRDRLTIAWGALRRGFN